MQHEVATNADSTLAQDSALNRDLQLATGDSAAQPQLKDVPPAAAPDAEPTPATTTRPRTPRADHASDDAAPTPTAPPPRTASGNTVHDRARRAPRGGVGTIASGTTLTLASSSKVCTNTNKVGDRFTATLTSGDGQQRRDDPRRRDGDARGHEAQAQRERERQHRDGLRGPLDLVRRQHLHVDADVTTAAVDRVRASTKGKDAKKVAGGAILGAVIGQVIGKDTKGTVIGAAAGAAAGTAPPPRRRTTRAA